MPQGVTSGYPKHRLVFICHSSTRGVVELPRDLFDYRISLGTVHNIVHSAVAHAQRRERSQRIGALERGFSSPTRSLIIVVFRHTRRKGNDYAQAQTQPTATVREDPTATAGSPRGDPGRDPGRPAGD